MTSLGATLDTFPPVFQESLARIRARMDADANAGLDVDSPLWIDTREGTFYWDITQVCAMEMARLWDAISVEMPASGIPFYSWGVYLDAHAAIFQLLRKLAIPAEGNVQFNARANTLIAAGTVVAAPSQDPNASPIEFQTTQDGTTPPALGVPVPVAVSDTSGGALAAGTYYYVVSAVNQWGETLPSAQAAAMLPTTGQVDVTWPAITGATSYRVYRSNVNGAGWLLIGSPTIASLLDNGLALGSQAPSPLDLSSGVSVVATALIPGTAGNVDAGAITQLESPNPNVLAVANPGAMEGGTEDETDEELRQRIQQQLLGAGGGVNSYVVWSLEQPGVARVFVDPVAGGPGTVTVVIMSDMRGDPVASSVVTALQALLDPVPGQAKGLAPPGAAVTVSTTTITAIDITATITFKAGYSLDGIGGGIASRQRIVSALDTYISSLDVGETVVWDHVKAQFFTVPGVYQVPSLNVNGNTVSGGDITISSSPPHVAQLGSTTLS